MPLGVILAGGRATRMGGGDKALLPLGRVTILGHVVARFAPQVGAVMLNANGDPARFAGYGLPVVADTVADWPGPLAGVLAGLDWAAARGARAVVTVAADTPFLPLDLVARLRQAAGGGLALAATPAKGAPLLHPTFGLWPVSLRDALRVALAEGTRKVSSWAERQGAEVAMFPAGSPDPFFNVNTPEDLRRAEGML